MIKAVLNLLQHTALCGCLIAWTAPSFAVHSLTVPSRESREWLCQTKVELKRAGSPYPYTLQVSIWQRPKLVFVELSPDHDDAREAINLKTPHNDHFMLINAEPWTLGQGSSASHEHLNKTLTFQFNGGDFKIESTHQDLSRQGFPGVYVTKESHGTLNLETEALLSMTGNIEIAGTAQTDHQLDAPNQFPMLCQQID